MPRLSKFHDDGTGIGILDVGNGNGSRAMWLHEEGVDLAVTVVWDS